MAKTKRATIAPDDSVDFVFTPQPRTSILTVALCVLNILAAIGFLGCMLMAHQKHQAWTHAVLMYDLAYHGLPLNQEDLPSGSREATPRPIIRSEHLQNEYQARKPGGGGIKEPFVALEEFPPPRIMPKNLNLELLADYFQGLGPPVLTLEVEVKRVRASLLNDIEKAGQEAAAAAPTPEARRAKLEKILLTQARDVHELREFDMLIRKTEDDKLEQLLAEAVQRRMLLDIIRPVAYSTPGDHKRPFLEAEPGNYFDSKKFDLEQSQEKLQARLKLLEEKITKRLDNALKDKYDGEIHYGNDWNNKDRDTMDKRRNIAFLLFTIAHLTRPDEKFLDDKFLVETGPARAQAVLGVYWFAWAAIEYNKSMKRMEARVAQRIDNDRQGLIYDADGKRMARFLDMYPELISKIRYEMELIEKAKVDLKGHREREDNAKKAYEERELEYKAKADKLLVRRAETARLAKELSGLRLQLFQAQLEFMDAARMNEELYGAIRKGQDKLNELDGFPAGGK